MSSRPGLQIMQMICGHAPVVDSLCAMDAEETAETLLNIAGLQVEQLINTSSWPPGVEELIKAAGHQLEEFINLVGHQVEELINICRWPPGRGIKSS